jgi:nitrogen regulatory protein P-II 1
MKKIEAVIRPFMVDDVTDALIALGVGGLTVTEVRGSGNEADRAEHHSDTEYSTDLVPKAAVEVVVADDVVAAVVGTICRVARTELAGDGHVFVLPVSAAIRIRTGEAGKAEARGRVHHQPSAVRTAEHEGRMAPAGGGLPGYSGHGLRGPARHGCADALGARFRGEGRVRVWLL